MEQAEILSFVERLIPVYHSDDFDLVLSQMTEGEHPSAKIIIKMELKRVMAPCSKSIDLRGRVQGDCREYNLNGIRHWFDDVAINAYHKKIKRYGGYTEGVWEALINTRNNFRVMSKVRSNMPYSITDPESPYEAELIRLGYDLRRQENRLRMASQVNIKLSSGQEIHGVSVDLSCSGARFKVPSAFDYRLGEVIQATFVQIAKEVNDPQLEEALEYRILGVDDCYENNSVRWLRLKRLTDTDVIAHAIEELLQKSSKRAKHDNQDHILRARSRGYEHCYLRHTTNLPLFFSGTSLRYGLLTDANQSIWNYWHDERNQQAFGTLFTKERMAPLIQPGMKESSNFVYSFTHDHQDKTLFYSMMLPEASIAQRQLFWHVGARRDSWRVHKLHMFELTKDDIEHLLEVAPEMKETLNTLTHIGILQEVSDATNSSDYLLTEKPTLPSSELNPYRHSRSVVGSPQGVYFDASTQRKEPRFMFDSPVAVTANDEEAIKGKSVNFSTRGIHLTLESPLSAKAGDEVRVNYLELQRYDTDVPLSDVNYQVIRLSPDSREIQLTIIDSQQANRSINFLKRLISHNQSKLVEDTEELPSKELLNAMHLLLLNRMVSIPFYIEKKDRILQPRAVGVNFPLHSLAKILQSLGHAGKVSLEPLFKNRTNTLLASPMRPVEGAKPQFHDLYIGIIQNGKQIEQFATKLHSDFETIEERILFVKKTKLKGKFYALRLSGMPIFESTSNLLNLELGDLAKATMHHARALEKEFNSLVGYGELVDITDEVLIRLELTE
ncbi:PilZ domain-containing protein [Vibrio tapetis]|uniref:Putative Type IV pilus assembly PilZ n=1 Tax=Vibrio tapetis subsp. tapetis TaxID=1671868 RepID=A0A2N8ZCA8_9VIBR|nr:PilZ domain-containing protein [Vibrio tapetis]SON49529.1 putative Type IV pilus assembly PilZ [Vibrio tapetis subsp. tapetis]